MGEIPHKSPSLQTGHTDTFLHILLKMAVVPYPMNMGQNVDPSLQFFSTVYSVFYCQIDEKQ